MHMPVDNLQARSISCRSISLDLYRDVDYCQEVIAWFNKHVFDQVEVEKRLDIINMCTALCAMHSCICDSSKFYCYREL